MQERKRTDRRMRDQRSNWKKRRDNQTPAVSRERDRKGVWRDRRKREKVAIKDGQGNVSHLTTLDGLRTRTLQPSRRCAQTHEEPSLQPLLNRVSMEVVYIRYEKYLLFAFSSFLATGSSHGGAAPLVMHVDFCNFCNSSQHIQI